MHVQLLKLDQSVSLEDTSTTFSVVLQLPNGQLVRASVDNETTQAILECQVQDTPPQEQTQEEAPPLPAPGFTNNAVHVQDEQKYEPAPELPSQQATPPAAQPALDPSAPEFNEGEADERVKWRLLDDTVLTPRMKSILNAVGLADEVSITELKRTVEKIVSKMPRPVAQAPQRAPQDNGARQPARTKIPGVGEVVWRDGPVVIDRPPRRTVPKDDFGYPIVPGTAGTRDPGELVGRGDLDEDGVGQL